MLPPTFWPSSPWLEPDACDWMFGFSSWISLIQSPVYIIQTTMQIHCCASDYSLDGLEKLVLELKIAYLLLHSFYQRFQDTMHIEYIYYITSIMLDTFVWYTVQMEMEMIPNHFTTFYRFYVSHGQLYLWNFLLNKIASLAVSYWTV